MHAVLLAPTYYYLTMLYLIVLSHIAFSWHYLFTFYIASSLLKTFISFIMFFCIEIPKISVIDLINYSKLYIIR